MKPLSRLLMLTLMTGGLMAQPGNAEDLKIGDLAPDFTLPGTDGKTYTLSKDLRGHWVVLGWFPKAFTGG